MTKFIINADDFGYSSGVNLGIIEAYQNGVVTSATMMTNMPGAAHAAKLSKENPELGVGIHLVLDCGFPVSRNVPSLVDEDGKLLKIGQLEKLAEIADIEKEYKAQIERFLEFGLTPTHIDSHHHLHGHPKIYPVVEKLAKEYRLPIRKVSADPSHSSNQSLITAECFTAEFYGSQLTVEMLIRIFENLRNFETAEIMCHPAYVDEPLLEGSSYALERVRELAILTNDSLRNYILEKDIELVTYRALSD